MIRAHVLDVDALAARTPAELATYLLATGWTLVRQTDLVAYWSLPVGEDEFEIMQPRDPAVRDYALRMGDAVVTLAAAEDRSELDILRRISHTAWDVHAFRLFPADEAPGMIPLEDGVAAYESLRALVGASAYPVFSKRDRALQPARKPQDLVDFLRGVRIGAAEEGSFVLTAHVPVPPRLSSPARDSAEGRLDADEAPGRLVSLRMHSAVRAAYDAAEAALLTTNGLDLFTQAVHKGLSANLCEALSGLGGTGSHPFEFVVSLAATRRAPQLAPVRFRRDHLPVLREAAAELRARTPEEDVSVSGEVVRLYREGNTTGEITVVGRVDDSETLRRVWMDLGNEDYEEAMRAHRDMRQITVRGNLLRRGTRYHLSNPTGFQVEPETDR